MSKKNCSINSGRFITSIIIFISAAKLDDWIFAFQKIPNLIYANCDTRFNLQKTTNLTCLFDESTKDFRFRINYLNELTHFWKNKYTLTQIFWNLCN